MTVSDETVRCLHGRVIVRGAWCSDECYFPWLMGEQLRHLGRISELAFPSYFKVARGFDEWVILKPKVVGRPAVKGEAMTAAERARAYRERKKKG